MKEGIINTVLGYLLLSFGVATSLTAAIAYSPTDVVLTIMDNELTSISYSTSMVIMHGVIAIVVIIIKLLTNARIKYRTVIVGFLGLSIAAYTIGFFRDIFYANLLPNGSELHMIIRLLMFISGYILTTLGAYLFTVRELITPPYDLFPNTVAEVTGRRMGSIRVIYDSSFTVIAVLLLFVTSGLSVIDDVISIFNFNAYVPLNIASIFMGVGFGYMFKIYERIPLCNIGVK